jgi:DNA-binding response OmpR family regulator
MVVIVLYTCTMTSVIIVEDDPFILDITTLKCSEHGYAVTVCTNGEETLEAFDRMAFDVIILDLDLPDMSGTTLLKNIKSHPNGHKTNVVVFSNSTDPTKKTEITEIGMLGYFEKSSAEYEELFALVDSAMLYREKE